MNGHDAFGISKSMNIAGVGRVRFRSKSGYGGRTHTTQARVKSGGLRHEVGTLRLIGPKAAGKTGEIVSINTKRAFQRKGIGTGMVRHAENTGRQVYHSSDLSGPGAKFASKVSTKAGGTR